MSPEDTQVRVDICKDCARECAVRETINHRDPCEGCPHGVFGSHADCGKITGLGDAVAVVAQPIARIIDAVTGGRTNVAGCGGCKKRQAALNKAVPFGGIPKSDTIRD